MQSSPLTLVIISAVVILVLSAGVPIAVGMGLVGFSGLYFLAGPALALNSFTLLIHAPVTNFVLLAIPLFVLMGEIIIASGLAATVYKAMEGFFSGFRAGMALATVGAGTVMAAVSGSSVANCATLGPLALREMLPRGYSKSLTAGLVAAVGGLAVIIPPSGAMIIYGAVSETSVARLFIGGVIPGLMMAFGCASIVLVWTRAGGTELKATPVPLNIRIRSLLTIWPLGVIAVLVMGSMYAGVASPTEAAAVGLLVSLIFGFAYRQLNWTKLRTALLSASRTCGFLFFIIIGAYTFGFLMSYLRVPQLVVQMVLDYGLSPLVFLLVINLLFLVLGCVMDSMSLLLIVVPIVLPALRQFNFDLVWLGVMLVINIEMGFTTPPIGINLFALQGVGKPFGVTFRDVVTGAAPFLLADAVVLGFIIMFPQLVLWLPNLMIRTR